MERSPKTTGAASQCCSHRGLPPELRTGDIPPGVGTADLTMVVRADEVPPVGRMVTVQLEMPPDSVSMSLDSPQTVAFDDSAAASVPMSPNQVRVDVQDEGTVFEVSQDTSEFLMRPSGASALTLVANCPFPSAVNPFSDPVLGDPIAFAQCTMILRSDTPMTLPVYTMSSGLLLMPGQSYVETIRASAESSQVEGWSAGTSLMMFLGRARFDAYTTPKDTGNSPLVATGLLGCLYRITSYTGRQSLIRTRLLECNFIIPGFCSSSGRRSKPGFCTIPRRFGFNAWVGRMLWQLLLIYNGTLVSCYQSSNLQILSQFVTSMHRISTEIMSLGLGQVVFPSEEVAALSTTPRVFRHR